MIRRNPEPPAREVAPDPVESRGAGTDPSKGRVSEAAGSESGPSEASEASSGGHRALARLYEEEQRVDGRFRWTVGSAKASCSACLQEIPAETPFHTVLVESDRSDATQIGDPLETWERRDLCDACFEGGERDGVFAFWKSVLPPTEEAPLKRVNLASLRSYFDRMLDPVGVEESAQSDPDQGDEGHEDPTPADQDSPEASLSRAADVADSAGDHPADTADAEADPGREAASSGVEAESGVKTLAYLLGLFLVRKRNLKWVNVQRGKLTLRCPQTDREYELETPVLSEEQLHSGISAFEELFG